MVVEEEEGEKGEQREVVKDCGDEKDIDKKY